MKELHILTSDEEVNIKNCNVNGSMLVFSKHVNITNCILTYNKIDDPGIMCENNFDTKELKQYITNSINNSYNYVLENYNLLENQTILKEHIVKNHHLLMSYILWSLENLNQQDIDLFQTSITGEINKRILKDVL